MVGEDVFVAFSPERVDPGNPSVSHEEHAQGRRRHHAGVHRARHGALRQLHRHASVPVSSPEAAELVKLLENTFRSVNIGLVNEMAIVCDKLGVDVWEVIEAAATKPFGFMKFTPGPGIGGHCIPLDPHYLAWKMRTLNYKTRFIDLASEINSQMPHFVVEKVSQALNAERKPVNGSNVLVLGVAYKRDIDDVRESPALDVIRLLEENGAQVTFHDPYIREYSRGRTRSTWRRAKRTHPGRHGRGGGGDGSPCGRLSDGDGPRVARRRQPQHHDGIGSHQGAGRHARGQFARRHERCRLRRGVVNICIVGTGYVGLVVGACLAETGNQVIGADVDAGKDRRASAQRPAHLRAGARSTRRAQSGSRRLPFTTDVAAAIAASDVVFIAVGTPPDEDGSADLRHVLTRRGARSAATWRARLVVVTKSTVPVGTATKVTAAVGEHARLPVSRRQQSRVPEGGRGGRRLHEAGPRRARRRDGSCAQRDGRAVRAVRAHGEADHLHGRSVGRDDEVRRERHARDAHLVHERHRRICASASARTSTSCARASASDERIGPAFLFPGPGYGGSCFPKDVKALVQTARDEVDVPAHSRSRRGGQRRPEAPSVREAVGAALGGERRGSARRRVGTGVQAEYRRHARSARAHADRGAARRRRDRSSRTIRSRWTRRRAGSAIAVEFAASSYDALDRRRRAGRRDRLERVPPPGFRAHQAESSSRP